MPLGGNKGKKYIQLLVAFAWFFPVKVVKSHFRFSRWVMEEQTFFQQWAVLVRF